MPSLCEGVADPKQVATIPGPVFEIAVRGTTLLVASFHPFNAVPLGELVTVDLKTLQQRDIPRAQSVPARSLALSATADYWLEAAQPPSNQFELWRFAWAGPGEPQRIWTGALASDVMVVQDQVLFGGPDNLLRWSENDGMLSELAPNVNVLTLATDGEYAYWSGCQTKDAIERVPLAGGAVQPLLREAFCPNALVAEGRDLYFLDEFDAAKGLTSALQHVAGSGGSAEPVGIFITAGPQLAVDQANLYLGTSEGVYRVDRSTGSTSLAIPGAVMALASDEHCLYWAPRDSYSVYMIAK